MTSKNRLILKMEGAERSGNHLELSVFVEKTRQFLEFLKVSAKDSGESGAVFEVVNLSHSSPVTMDCVPVARGAETAPPSVIFNGIKEKLELTAGGQTRDLSHPVLDSLEKLADYQPEKLARIEIHAIAGDGKKVNVYVLNDECKEMLREARSSEDRVISTVSGKLEQINIHNDANIFRIYDSVPHAHHIDCKFPNELLESVPNGLGRFVSVWGECFYRPDAAAPYRVIVREMEILPPSNELPSLSDLRGIAPGATGGKSSEQFVRELRDEWDRDTQ